MVSFVRFRDYQLVFFICMFYCLFYFLPARRYASAGRPTSYGSVSVSLCLSATSRFSIETGERIELVFGMEASFHLSYTVLKGNSGISKNEGM